MSTALIGPDDPPPFEALNLEGRAPILITCDHASHAVPKGLDDLGLSMDDLTRHIGWDIGIAKVVRRMAPALDAPALLAGYSRLVIDLNRPHDSTRQPGSIPEASDHTPIPANAGISPAAAEARAKACFWPYHEKIVEILEGFEAKGVVPAYIAMHSFTPEIDGFKRPWEIGVCYRHDPRIPKPLIEALREDFDLCVGDNEPYAIEADSDYGIPVHGEGRGLPHALVEIRQDLLAGEDDAARWAGIMTRALTKVLADETIRTLKRFV